MSKETGQQGFRRTGSFHENELKVCDLCSSLNLASNTECFVCGWNGHFESSYEVVRTAVIVAIQRHGPLELENLTDIHTYREVAPTLKSRLRGWLLNIWKWLSG